MTTIEKFADLCHLISNDDGNGFYFWWDYMKIYENDTDYDTLKSKISNFITHLNENSEIWMKMDIETEIFNKV